MSVEHKLVENMVVNNDTVTFQFNASVRDANCLRRIFLTKIPMMAIDQVKIRKNTSVRTDEFLISRLQLIPIMTNTTDLPLNLSLNQTGGTVFSESITGGNIMPSIIVTKLNDTQSLNIDMVARKGTGDDHVRWSAVANVGFKPMEDNKVQLKVKSIGIHTPEKLVEMALSVYDNEKA